MGCRACSFLLGGFLLLGFGCGGSPVSTRPTTPEAEPRPVPSAKAAARPSAADYVVVARASLDYGVVERFWHEEVSSEPVTRFMDTQRPFDAVVLWNGQLDPEGLVGGIAISVVNVDQLVQEMSARPSGPNRWTFRSGKCAIVPSAGGASHRVICVDEVDQRALVAPYLEGPSPLARGETRGLVAELYLRPLYDRYREQAKQAAAQMLSQVSRAAAAQGELGELALEAAQTLATELLAVWGDAAQVALSVNLEDDVVTSDLAIRFDRSSSWWVHTLQAEQGNQSPPPSTFWSLPEESLSAGYRTAVDLGPYEGMREFALRLVPALAKTFEIPESLERSAVVLVTELFSHLGAEAVYSGQTLGRPTENPLFDGLTNSRGVMVSNRNLEQELRFVRELVSVLENPELGSVLKRFSADLASAVEHVSVRLGKSAPSDRLPKGSHHLQLRISPKAWSAFDVELPRKNLQWHLFLAPQQDHTWTAWGADRGRIARMLRATMKSKGPGLEAHRDSELLAQPARAAGLFSPESLERFLNSETSETEAWAPLLYAYQIEVSEENPAARTWSSHFRMQTTVETVTRLFSLVGEARRLSTCNH